MIDYKVILDYSRVGLLMGKLVRDWGGLIVRDYWRVCRDEDDDGGDDDDHNVAATSPHFGNLDNFHLDIYYSIMFSVGEMIKLQVEDDSERLMVIWVDDDDDDWFLNKTPTFNVTHHVIHLNQYLMSDTKWWVRLEKCDVVKAMIELITSHQLSAIATNERLSARNWLKMTA